VDCGRSNGPSERNIFIFEGSTCRLTSAFACRYAIAFTSRGVCLRLKFRDAHRQITTSTITRFQPRGETQTLVAIAVKINGAGVVRLLLRVLLLVKEEGRVVVRVVESCAVDKHETDVLLSGRRQRFDTDDLDLVRGVAFASVAVVVRVDIVNYDVRLRDNYDGRSTGVIVAVNWL